MSLSSAYEKIEALRPDYEYIDGDSDSIIATVGFVASFYFWEGHTLEKRLALADCLDAYRAAYGTQLTWGRDPESWKAIRLEKRPLPDFRNYLKELDEDDCIEWYESSGNHPDEVGEYVVRCMTERGWEEQHASCFQFHVPPICAFDEEKWKVLQELLTTCNERLATFHGNAGLAAVTTEQGLTWEPEILDLATRYRALSIEDFVTDGGQAEKGIKGINWLTFIGDLLTERLGGPKAFSTYCQRLGVSVERFTSGFIVRSGEWPQLGPVDEAPPEAYVRVNAALRPLRNGKYGSMGSGSIDGELRFNVCTSDLWIRRFDEPNVWPPISFAGLTQGPVGAKPTKRVKLNTGMPSTVHGRYRKYPQDPDLYNDDEEYDRTPVVTLLPGDIAPYYVKIGPHGEFLSRESVVWELVSEL